MGRSPCCDKASVKRGPWSQEEDAVLRSFVEMFGNAGNWITLPLKAGLKRCGKSCRLRWLNYLRPALRHGGFTEEEDDLILSLYGELGSKWSVIASKLAGRTDNDVKNYWNTKLKKRYVANSIGETTPPPAPTPTSGEIIPDDESSSEVERSPSPAAVNIDTALDDDGELMHKSEQLYAELMGLIEKNPTTTTASPSTDEAMAATSSSSSAIGTSAGSSMWPVGVHDTALLSESSSSSSSLLEFDDPYGAHAFGAMVAMPDSFQDLLASSYDEVMVTKEFLYY